MQIDRFDHFVLTVNDIDASIQFYTSVLGMQLETFGEGRKALKFAAQKLNLHQRGEEFSPNAKHAGVGTADICFITSIPLEAVQTHLESLGVDIELGIVERTGAQGAICSIYIRDPDGNLIELSNVI